MAQTMLIEVADVHKMYKPGSRSPTKAVDGVSFSVDAGEIVGLLGPNGAGKTTTIKMMCGLIHPDSGSVKVASFDARTQRRHAMRHISAVLEGNRNLYWRLTVRENLDYFAGNRGRSPAASKARRDELIERFGLAGKADALVSNLSRGMQQKLAIAVALLADTDALVLDEPTLGLDVETGHEVRALLQEIAADGKTVLLSSHDMPVVQALCQRAIIISGGKVVTDDSVANLMRLFQTRAFSVRLATPLDLRQQEELHAAFNVTASTDARTFEVEFAAKHDLYRLMDFLRATGAEVDSIERTSVQFEQVFRRLVNGNPAATTPARAAKPVVELGDAHVAV
ncbi:MAG TPA: ABC transporter ATP-binding protein [Trueperaceae bacterium]|nr:ABC transporter ATP-binding protein [Trueperaceae bacterium]